MTPRPPKYLRPALVVAAFVCFAPQELSAQLISERVEEGVRICTYYGSERAPNDELLARELRVGLGEDCPAVAYARETVAPAHNAQLVREEAAGGARLCIFVQGGREFRLRVPFSTRCAMTPALQQMSLEQASGRR